MQCSMWLILGATVGLAALLDRNQNSASLIHLDPPMRCGQIRIALPANWTIDVTDPGMLTAADASSLPSRFELEVTVAPPAEKGLLDQLLSKGHVGTARTIGFGAASGTLYASQTQFDEDGQSGTVGQVIATATMPKGPQVTLRLQHFALAGDSIDSDDDISLVRRIAATVKVSQLPPTGDDGPED